MTNRILIITSNASDSKTLADTLGAARDGQFITECATRLAAGIKRLRKGGIDAVLLDLALPDSKGVSTFKKLFACSPRTPILALAATEEEVNAIEAVKLGAQGYLSKGHFASSLVPQSLRNIIQRKELEEQSYQQMARAEIALNSIHDAVICTDIFGNINYLNIGAETLTGWSKKEAEGQPVGKVFKIINGKTRQPERNTVELVLQKNKVLGLPTDTLLIRKDGSEALIEDSTSPIHDWDNNLTGAVIVFHDVSAAQATSTRMAHLAQHDFLTNLPNRILFEDRIAQAITLANRNDTQLALLFLDLDNFKYINDSLGHATGDAVLQSVARRLEECIRHSDTVCRQGGDEFVILLVGGKHGEEAAFIADKILNTLARPHLHAKNELYVTSSIGISIYPGDGLDAKTLIKSADTAMYYAKEKGKNNHQFFQDGMNTRAVERQSIETSLRRALEANQFVLHYQPKINLATGKISGVEALLRWDHPEWGMVMPNRYLRIAEDCGLIVAIGKWVLREACAQAQKWQHAGLPISIEVNISALEFRQVDFFESVKTTLIETGLEPHFLQLEITESVLMSNAQSSKTILQNLKKMGVLLAVGDFGTGYSSLSYLNQFPLDVLKIDQSFVDGIGKSNDSNVIVSAVIGMGNNLRLKVIAEGVENQIQLNFLKERNCLEGQGYLFSCPVAAPECTTLLESNHAQIQ